MTTRSSTALRRPAQAAPTPGPPLEPLLSIAALAATLACSRHVVERMRSAGKLPRPALHIGKRPRWKPQTIRKWIEEGSRA